MPLPKARRPNREDEDSDSSIPSSPSTAEVLSDGEDEEESVIDDSDAEESEASVDIKEEASPQAVSVAPAGKGLDEAGENKATTKSPEGVKPKEPTDQQRGVSGGARREGSNVYESRREYQRRLKNDPTFTPFVGSFWSHDDRHAPEESKALMRSTRQSQAERADEDPVWQHDKFESDAPPPSSGGRAGRRGRGRMASERGRGKVPRSRRPPKTAENFDNLSEGKSNARDEQNQADQANDLTHKTKGKRRLPKKGKARAEDANEMISKQDEREPEKDDSASATVPKAKRRPKTRKVRAKEILEQGNESTKKTSLESPPSSKPLKDYQPPKIETNAGDKTTQPEKLIPKIPEREDPWAGLDDDIPISRHAVPPVNRKTAFPLKGQGRGRGRLDHSSSHYRARRDPYNEPSPERSQRDQRRYSLEDGRPYGGSSRRSYGETSDYNYHRLSGGGFRGRSRGLRGGRGLFGRNDRPHPTDYAADSPGVDARDPRGRGRRGTVRFARYPQFKSGDRQQYVVPGKEGHSPLAPPEAQAYHGNYYPYEAMMYQQAYVPNEHGVGTGQALPGPYQYPHFVQAQVTCGVNGEQILLAQTADGLMVPLQYFDGSWGHQEQHREARPQDNSSSKPAAGVEPSHDWHDKSGSVVGEHLGAAEVPPAAAD